MSKVNAFVNKDKIIDVKIYIKQIDDKIIAVSSLDFIDNEEDKKEYEEVSFSFRQPLLSDLAKIIESSFAVDSASSDFKINPMSLRIKRMEILLKDWSFTSENGNKIPINKETINSLSPNIVAVANEVFESKQQL